MVCDAQCYANRNPFCLLALHKKSTEQSVNQCFRFTFFCSSYRLKFLLREIYLPPLFLHFYFSHGKLLPALISSRSFHTSHIASLTNSFNIGMPPHNCRKEFLFHSLLSKKKKKNNSVQCITIHSNSMIYAVLENTAHFFNRPFSFQTFKSVLN